MIQETSPPWLQILSPEWYLARHPEVVESGLTPLEHYAQIGFRKKWSPHPLFDVKWYRRTYPDTASNRVNPIVQYFDQGAANGRDPHPLFDTAWYLVRHPELADSGENPLLHYIARHGTDWRPLVPALVEKIRRIQHDPASWPPVTLPTAEAGIVISASGKLFRPLHANLRLIRRQGCALPIDVWHLPGEFTATQLTALRPHARFVEAAGTPFEGLSGHHEVHGFKAWMLSQSRFRKTLMLDVNSFPLQDLAALFASSPGCLLWRDGPWGCCAEKTAFLRQSLGLPVPDCEFESGQLLVDRGRPDVREALRLAAALNTLGSRLYACTYGDKETYALACDLLGVPYAIAPEPQPFRHAESVKTNSGVLQPWLDGSPLFYHPLSDRELWWHYHPDWAALAEEARTAEAACL
ncbi:MAG: hypothetical protein ABIT76_06360 [Chthoniobacterales bacterium]